MEFEKYISERIRLFDRIKSEQTAGKKEPIEITTEFGKHAGTSHETTPFSISKQENKNHANFIVARVNGTLWDAHRPLEEDSTVEFLTFDDEEGKRVFWHSSAHILGEACESAFCSLLCLGPPTDSGFFYEMSMSRSVVPEDYKVLRKEMKRIVKENQPFERLVLKKAQLLEMFADNPLKAELISQKVQEESTVYRCGSLIDFCLGPHIPHTGYVRAIDVLHNSSAFFLGDSNRPVLQRVYGVSFPQKTQLLEHLKNLEEAKKNNHRKIGSELSLFFFSPYSPGSCFFLPKGAFVYNALVNLMREHYRKKGFKEVITPNIFTNELWAKSGHLEKYREDMFCLHADGTEMALKPMNCPAHCLLFEHLACSYRELPLRIADFGVLHRNEVSGALTGLTRVRRFQQDDAHIFAPAKAVAGEIRDALEFLREVYTLLGFTYAVSLSTRPEKFLGEVALWDTAESQLKSALQESGLPWTLNEGDGAFYGPKIDISLCDALGRKHQCGTIQLDFQLPIRFDLSFAGAEGERERPVMIHRAILGSVERMTGILLEHARGRLPPWINPSQVAVIPVSPAEGEYAREVQGRLRELEVVVDLSESTLNKKILNAEKSKFSYILIVGKREAAEKSVSFRNLRPGETLYFPLEDAREMLLQAVGARVRTPGEILNFVPKPRKSPGVPAVSQAWACLERILAGACARVLEALRGKVKPE
ncbi:threonyl-tRNA synthetase [Nematocida major]|uniref:threonyl-tRNA synthetase n=1 Tax=Nematocida major TaxID=1912982 RepID=UPI0020088DFE|nr:threonyl-tRNA synthetase [Nematocida major]KAH9385816.1 threonyl-tRNA synthetase [Nematocida major]